VSQDDALQMLMRALPMVPSFEVPRTRPMVDLLSWVAANLPEAGQ
jgi:hypothetical protein